VHKREPRKIGIDFVPPTTDKERLFMIHQKDSGQVGKTILHYDIIEKLGEGGIGVVYKAEDTKLRRLVALKFLSSKSLADPEEKKRFVREAQAAAVLNHANICTVHEIGQSEGQNFIVMEYVDGQSLDDRIKGGLLELAEAVEIAKKITAGLQAAHKKNIVHRDIKSANIILTSEGHVKITDFGLAKKKGDVTITKTGSQMGTAAYMSPEQIQGEPVDHQSDIFSFGVLLYEMLTGLRPFKGENQQATMFSILYHQPKSVREIQPDIPIELEQIIKKSLEKEKENRYQSAHEILADLMNLCVETDDASTAQPIKKVANRPRTTRFILLDKRIYTPIMGIILLLSFFWLLKILLFNKDSVINPTIIAVISFENQTGEKAYDFLQKAIPNLLITSLEQSPYFQVTTWERLNDLLKKSDKKDVTTIDKNTGFELCEKGGVEAIVLGSFIKAGDVFATDMKVINVKTKKLLASVSSRGRGAGSILENQIDDLSREVSRGIGLTEREVAATESKIAEVTTTSIDAYNYFLQGKDVYEKSYYNEAKIFLEKAIAADSTFAIAYLYLAATYASLGQSGNQRQANEKARLYSRKATEKERLYIEAAYAWYVDGNSEKRFQILQQIAKKFPDEKRVHLLLGSTYRFRKQYDKSIEELNKVLILDNGYGKAISSLAFTYSRMGNYEKAIEYYSRFVSVSPNDASPFSAMGGLYVKMGRFDEALVKLNEALAVKSDFGSEWRIAYIYALKEDYKSSIKWINQYINMMKSPGKKAQGYTWRGLYNYWSGDNKQSEKDMNKALALTKLSGNDYGASTKEMLKGWIYFHKGNFELSRKYFKKYYNFVQKYRHLIDKFASIINLGFVDVATGQIDSAIARLNKAITLSKDISEKEAYWAEQNISFHFLRMEILMAEGAFKKAIAIGENIKPVEIPSLRTKELLVHNIPFLQDILARAYIQNGNFDKAITEYEQLITLDPNSRDRRLIHPKYHYRLAILYEQKGWPGKAIEEYEKFLEIWKHADADLPELIEAKKRLGNLSKYR
jgi:serine/threonine protein kinase/Flp pilus assembly protein TadD